MDAGAAEDRELDDIFVDVVDEGDLVEGAIVITHMIFPAGTKHSW